CRCTWKTAAPFSGNKGRQRSAGDFHNSLLLIKYVVILLLLSLFLHRCASFETKRALHRKGVVPNHFWDNSFLLGSLHFFSGGRLQWNLMLQVVQGPERMRIELEMADGAADHLRLLVEFRIVQVDGMDGDLGVR